MRRTWQCSLTLVLGLLGTAARAGDGADPTPIASTNPAALLGKPLASSHPAAPPAASLARPVAPGAGGMIDAQLRPTTFSTDSTFATSATHDANPDTTRVRPTPVGTPAADPTAGLELHGWSRPSSEALGMPRTAGPGSAVTTPAPGVSAFPTATVPGTVMAGPVVGGPALMGDGLPGHPMPPGVCDCGPQADCGSCCGHGGDCCSGCGCGAGCGCGDGCCHFGNRWYFGVEYLSWRVKGDPVPPLVTTGSVNDLIPGALGQPSTVVVFGDQALGQGARSGARFTGGFWFFDDHALGLEGNYFFLGRKSDNFTATSFGNPLLARPFHEAFNDVNTAEQVANVATARLLAIAGTITVNHTSSLWGTEANLRGNLRCGPNGYVDLLGGFRVLGLDESLTINEALVSLDTTGTGPRPGTTFAINDRFSTTNRFYGGQIGAVGEWKLGRWVFDGTAKFALGVTQERADVSGFTVIANSGTTLDGTYVGGLLAQRTNIGSYTRNVFTFVPELGATIGYQFTDRLRGFVGYTFLYSTNVARPGNQIDTTVDRRLLPPPTSTAGLATRPAFSFNGSDFWAQGLTFGLEYRY
jgi:hypothetical protein